MRATDFDYLLPPNRVAAFPAEAREASRLMRLDRREGTTAHVEFRRIAEHLPARSVIVLNDARVIPARLRGKKPNGGSIELLLVRRVEGDTAVGGAAELWEALGRNLTRAEVGLTLTFDGGLRGQVVGHGAAGALTVSLLAGEAADGESVVQALDRVGELPLPPYIEAARKREVEERGGMESDTLDPRHRHARELDRERYQTVYASAPGAVAAPTAGLHFTDTLLAELAAAGHTIARLTLNVGLGTFRPVKVDDIEQHDMDAEWYSIPAATAQLVNDARRSGRPVLAVGTTVVRALESSVRAGEGTVRAGAASSRLFLRPGDDFLVVTDLLTNFHLPRSTLLMLVAAFAGREKVLAAYQEAVAAGYRFYSYGDAMLIRGAA